MFTELRHYILIWSSFSQTRPLHPFYLWSTLSASLGLLPVSPTLSFVFIFYDWYLYLLPPPPPPLMLQVCWHCPWFNLCNSVWWLDWVLKFYGGVCCQLVMNFYVIIRSYTVVLSSYSSFCMLEIQTPVLEQQ